MTADLHKTAIKKKIIINNSINHNCLRIRIMDTLRGMVQNHSFRIAQFCWASFKISCLLQLLNNKKLFGNAAWKIPSLKNAAPEL